MIASRGMFIRGTAYKPSKWKDIRVADMNELSEITDIEGVTYESVG